MFKAFCAPVAAALLTGTAVPAVAQTAAAPSQTQATTEAKPAQKSNEIVCQKQEVTGTRLGVKRICMTRSQWADRQMQDRQEIERVQVQRGELAE